MSRWTLVYHSFDPQQEPLREAFCTLSNGYFATRGAAEEAHADDVHYPGTYLAGGFNRLDTVMAGRTIVNEDLVNFPNWLPLTFRIGDGDWFHPQEVELLEYRQELRMKQGILVRSLRFRDQEGRQSTVTNKRLVHMGDPHLAAIEYSITPENWSGSITVKSALDGSVINAGVKRYRELNSKHLQTIALDNVGVDGIYLRVRTVQSGIQVAEAARTQLFCENQRVVADVQTYQDAESIRQEFTIEIAAGQPISIEKIVALYSSSDSHASETDSEARQALARCGRFRDLLRSHSSAWRSLWRRCDVTLQPHYQEQLILRLHLFHLLQTVSMNTVGLDVGVAPRGLHGEAYRGHIFWDELFILPFYNLCIPESSRSLLLYRYRRIDSARAYARENGYQGAMYPWQSGSDGQEETQEVHLNPLSGQWLEDNSRVQRHINSAIAYNIWQYFQVSRDMDFLASYGAEMVLEIARFWASIATYNASSQRYEIAGVMGPDEYHDHYPGTSDRALRNNAYTNVMAVWVLERALEVLGLLPKEHRQRLIQKIGLLDEELNLWEEMTRRMTIPFHGDGIISQFEGYDRLEEFDWAGYRDRYDDIGRLDRILEAEGDSPNRYKVSKQADVCMLFYLLSLEELRRIFRRLGYPFDSTAFRRNVSYYLSRTSHGSTLSKVVYASLLDRLDRHAGWQLFKEALQSDIADTQGGTTHEGIHLGTMAGTVLNVLHDYAGIDATGEVVRFDPRLPRNVRESNLRFWHRGHGFEMRLTKKQLSLTISRGGRESVAVRVKGETHHIPPGSTQDFLL